ncbi:MAG TPA: aminotransferase class V-fold PLP-dependent enzyme [Vicinamibacteria bacterium]|nr:aminotransferase class V-fold PLP-dependent enzyme [Vicinamibacteria bacterium]
MSRRSHPLEPEPRELEAQTRAVAEFVLEQVSTLDGQPSFDLDGADELRASFREGVPETGRPLPELLGRLGSAIAKSYNTAGPGYLAYIPGGGVYAAALADLVAAATNRYVGVTGAAPALAQIEETAVSWLCTLMGLPAGARGILTSGGSLSNFSAIATARHERLGEDFRDGVIYFSAETHHCVPKAARLAGFPRAGLRVLPTDARFRLVPEALDEAIREDRARGRRPFLVVVSVGTTNTGAIDPLPEVLDIARGHGLWVHADAAYGGFFRLAPGGDDLLRGIEECDSITLDPHKGLFLPYGLGALLVRDGGGLARAHRDTASYVQDVAEEGSLGFADLSPELSRDFRGLRLWLPLMLHGLAAFREQLAEKLALARWAYDELKKDARFEVLDEPQLSIVAFRLRAPADEADRLGPELLRRVNERRRVFLSSTRIAGRYALRICVLSFRTHEDRLRDAVTALKEEARILLG